MAMTMVGWVRRTAAPGAFLIACAVLGAPGVARADRFQPPIPADALWSAVLLQEQPSLRDRLFGGGRRETAPVARFTTEDGPSFILDQTGARPLLRYEGSSEIWVLRPSAGVRGDIYYRNDVGEVVLRATRIGGLTLYTHASPGGLPCALGASARALRMPDHDVRTLFRHLLIEAARGGRGVQRRSLEIVANDVDDSSAAIVGDTATVTVDAIVRLSQTPAGRERLANLTTVLIAFGSAPAVQHDGEVLRVTVTPRLGPAGRPSSARVMRAIG